MKYHLVNPQLDKKIYSKNNDKLEAAEDIWQQLSSNTKQYVPKSFFTLQKGSKFYHFNVKENLNKNNVSYKIKPYHQNTYDKDFMNFLQKQNGGKKKKIFDSSSSSSSSSDTESSINTDNLVYRFKTKDKVIYSKLKPTLVEYYDIYGVDYLLPTYYSSINVKFHPLDVIYV